MNTIEQLIEAIWYLPVYSEMRVAGTAQILQQAMEGQPVCIDWYYVPLFTEPYYDSVIIVGETAQLIVPLLALNTDTQLWLCRYCATHDRVYPKNGFTLKDEGITRGEWPPDMILPVDKVRLYYDMRYLRHIRPTENG